MKRLENILVVAFSILMFFGVFNAYAQDSINIGYKEQEEAINQQLGVPIDETNSVTTSANSAMSIGTVILSTTAPALLSGTEAMNTDSPEFRKGLIGMLDDGMSTLYTGTANINLYAHLAGEWVPGYDKTNSGIYAAESGYDELMNSGIEGIWGNIRDLSYVFFIVIMLVAGFMIMFRHKIGGQSLVTLGNALPNVIISLILVTFSFAIAGLIIDMGGVAMVIVQDILGLNKYVSTHSLWSLMGEYFSGTGRVLGAVGIGGVSLATTIIGILGLFGVFGSTGPVGWVALGSVGLLFLLMILLIVGVVLVGSIKVLITLIKAYVGILFSVIMAPLQLAFGALPGNQQMIKNWFNDLLRNVFVFPVVFFIMNIPLAIADTSNLNLGFPEKLVYVDSISDANGMDGMAALFMFLIQIIIYFYAAQAPKFLEAIFPPSTPKAVQEGLAMAKGGLSKIPLVGGIFK